MLLPTKQSRELLIKVHFNKMAKRLSGVFEEILKNISFFANYKLTKHSK